METQLSEQRALIARHDQYMSLQDQFMERYEADMRARRATDGSGDMDTGGN